MVNHKQINYERGAPATKDSDWDIETIIEQVWNDLQGRVSRTDILGVIQEIMPRYENARISTYVPLFIRREAAAMLQAGLAKATPDNPAPTPSKADTYPLSNGRT